MLIGLPFMLEMFGPQGFETLSLILAVHLPIMIGVTTLLIAMAKLRGGAAVSFPAVLRGFLGQLLSNPLILGILAGLAWGASGFALPTIVERLVGTMADIGGPTALFAVGLSLLRFGFRSSIGFSAALGLTKLFLMPAAALAMVLLLDLPSLHAKVVVIAAAMPLGVNPYLIAARFGTGERIASNAMTLSTAIAVLTTLFWATVVEAVL